MSSQPRPRNLTTEEAGDVLVVRFTGRRLLEEKAVNALTKYLTSLVNEGDRRKLVLNLGRVEVMNTSMVAGLLNLNKTLKARKGGLALCRLTPQLSELFEALGLIWFLKIHNEEQEAVQSLQAPEPRA